eukprot:TRINITY_DN24517_c0_g1_i1.p1 TRINITY_DN24517_c0_g1~~TRINITY_DN24517_c0_g1_i1.p1  ORF type:complete len:343 (+),score=70.89 TRINITY_DN24517_c0_g1_i1:73-1101(+)
MSTKVFGQCKGQDVHLVTLKTPQLEVDVSTLGAGLVSVRVLVKGDWIDVILGYETAEQYPPKGKPNFGTAVGRCANRVRGGKFEVDGVAFQLDKNNGENSLHGGLEGFYSQVWTIASSSETTVALALSEPDGHMGYPGKVDVTVIYEVKGSELHFRYEGVTDKPTILSMTNHGYWNLKGHSAGDVLDHSLSVAGSRITAVDDSLAMTGELVSVEGTGLDLREGPCLKDAVEKAGPIDANYCLEKPADQAEFKAATLSAPNGLSMEVWTDQPGLQVMTGQNIDPSNADFWHGKGTQWQKFGAICLEPQLWPDGINQKEFPSPILRPGETYRHHSWHVFSVKEA